MQEINRSSVDTRLAQVMFRGGTPDFQARVSVLRQRISDLPELSDVGGWETVTTEKAFLYSLSSSKTLSSSHPDGGNYKVAKVVVGDDRWLVLDVMGEDTRSRSRIITEFMIAMERPRDFSIAFQDKDESGLEKTGTDRLFWSLGSVAFPLPAASA